MEIGWLEDFIVLTELEHFSHAAKRRNLTQPAFSRSIRSLEEWVGVPLFDRTSHPVQLTDAGRQFHPVAVETLRQMSQGRSAARQTGKQEAETLIIAATHTLSFNFFPDWLGMLGAIANVGSVRLISDNMQACEQVLNKGSAHFLLCHFHQAAPPQLDFDNFHAIAVGHDALALVASAHHAEKSLSGSGELPLLAYSAESGLGRIVAAVVGSHEHALRQQPVLSSHLAAVLRGMACNGRGMAWLPLSMIQGDLDQGRLRKIETVIPPIDIAIHLMRPRARLSHTAESAWASLCVQYASQNKMAE